MDGSGNSSHPLVVESPFLVMGDFKQILTADEHFSLVNYDLPVRGMTEFRDCFTLGRIRGQKILSLGNRIELWEMTSGEICSLKRLVPLKRQGIRITLLMLWSSQERRQ